MHDLKIENARICDGLGNPMIDGAVAVTAGRIAAIGDVPEPILGVRSLIYDDDWG